MNFSIVKACMATASFVCLGVTILGQGAEPIYDEAIKLVSFEDLVYPGIARMARVEGVVVVKATVNESGDVVEAQAVSGPRLLTHAATENARKWKWASPLRSTIYVVFNFVIEPWACKDGNRSLFVLRHKNMVEISACSEVIQG